MAQKTDNIWISFFIAFFRFFIAAGHSVIGLLGGKSKEKSLDYQNLNGISKEIPNSWKYHPTAIGLGRSVMVSILYFFQKHVYFHEKK